MRQIWRATTLLGAIGALVLAAQGIAASPTTISSVYSVGSVTVPGVDTGLVLNNGGSVTATATGTVCPGTGYCVGPDGYPSVDTMHSGYGGFVLPGAPAYGLVGRVGSGPWVQVGSGPTKLSGSGDLVFAVNDDLFSDNTGSFTVTVTYSRGSASQGVTATSCYPGWGYGDANHDHDGPPPKSADSCWPGYGYGDTNHDHSGPPGRDPTSTPGGASTQFSSSGHGKSDGKQP
jgi:hypothetical protein